MRSFALGLALAMFAGGVAAQAVCPLSDEQAMNSIKAFTKFVPTLQGEPRCTNCHGGLDPFAANTTHGGGTVDPGVPEVEAENGSVAAPAQPGTDCSVCHSDLAPRTNGQESIWQLAPAFMSFVGKDAPTLCEQIKDNTRSCALDKKYGKVLCGPWPNAEKFVGHVTDDEGKDNFTATAFRGMRGLPTDFDPDIVPEPPRGITHAGLIGLAHEWINTTGGKWQGHKDCGCRPSEYALRITAVTEIADEGIAFKSEMTPLEIPLTFADDGTFTGEAAAEFRGAGVADNCTLQGGLSVRLSASGEAVQTEEDQHFTVTLKPASQSASRGSVACPDGGASKQFSGSSSETYTIEMKGNVGEVATIPIASPAPGVSTVSHIEVVRK